MKNFYPETQVSLGWWQVEQNRTERIFEFNCGYNYVRKTSVA